MSFDFFETLELTPKIILAVFAVGCLMMAIGFTTTTFFSIFTGFIGGWSLVPYLVLSYSLASLLGFLLGRKLSTDVVRNLLTKFKGGRTLLSKTQEKSGMFIFSCRLSPLLPFGTVSYTHLTLPTIA